jgi:hypothetical protein
MEQRISFRLFSESMTRYLVWAVVGLVVLSAAGPAVTAFAKAAVPLVIAVGAVALVLRAVWYFTNRW